LKRPASARPAARAFILLCLATTGVFLAAACAHALKTPPSIQGLAGAAPPGPPADPEALVSEAQDRFARRDIEEAHRAASLALRAAAATTPTDGTALLLAIRIQVWLAEHEATSEARAAAATHAVQAAQWCDAAANPAPCAYWKAAALGQQARERPSTGLSALPLIEQGFKEAAATDPTLDEGGPDRALALLYLRAPGWPTGPGDPAKALEHARRATTLRERHAPNHLALAEALAKNGDADAAREEDERALRLAQEAQTAGDPDAGDWIRESERAIHGSPGR
jgi:tetratricopeptide (TPR) repeat protein